MRALVVEDSPAMAERMRTLLVRSGFAVDHAPDGEQGWSLGETVSYDAVLLDIGLPKMSGLDVLKSWRNAGRQVPVMLVTRRTGWQERVAGYNAGADDYLEKPFEDEEFVARIKSLMRRANGKNTPVLSHCNIELDSTCGLVRRNGEFIELTALELRILSYLMSRPERIVSQIELADHVYSIHEVRDSNTIQVYIARLRKKLGRPAIRTIRGMGYRMG